MSGLENKISYVVQSLKEYEGKWLLFDDSEVKVTEEKDFLNSLSLLHLLHLLPTCYFIKNYSECIFLVNIKQPWTDVGKVDNI